MSRTPAAATLATAECAAAGTLALAAQVADFMRTAPTLAAELWAGVERRSAAAGPAVSALIAAARAADGGKYVRPRLVAVAFYGLDGTDAELLRVVAGAQQLVHLGLCMHDDVIDGDRVRHGRANVAGAAELEARAEGLDATSAARRGLAAGVLAGDLALNTALLALARAGAAHPTRAKLTVAALEAIERTIAGELLDVDAESRPPARTEPLQIALLKTASYSVTLPLTLGAIAAGADEPALLASLERIGSAFGIAYQLSDDDLGLFGSPAVTGKSALSDLRDGKRTEHIKIAHELASADDRAFIAGVLGRDDADEDDARRVCDIVTATGARIAVHELIDRHLNHGVRVAREELPPALADHLAGLAGTLRSREH